MWCLYRQIRLLRLLASICECHHNAVQSLPTSKGHNQKNATWVAHAASKSGRRCTAGRGSLSCGLHDWGLHHGHTLLGSCSHGLWESLSRQRHRSCHREGPRQLHCLHARLRHERRVGVSHGCQKGLQRGGAGSGAGMRGWRQGIAGAQTLAGGADRHHRRDYRGWRPRCKGRSDCETAPSRRNCIQRPAVSVSLTVATLPSQNPSRLHIN